MFHELNPDQLKDIVQLLIKDLQKRLADRSLSITLSDEAVQCILDMGYDPQYGARPLRRSIERYIENPLATRLLSGEYKDGDHILVEKDDDGLVFTVSNTKPAKSQRK